MSTPLNRFAFVDATHAAEVLHVTQDTIVDWVASGKLRSYGGKPNNPFLRSADVVALVEEMGLAPDEAPKRTRSASARVQARLTADSRWSEIGEADIREWAQRAEPSRRQAALKASQVATQRLGVVVAVLKELTEGNQDQ